VSGVNKYIFKNYALVPTTLQKNWAQSKLYFNEFMVGGIYSRSL